MRVVLVAALILIWGSTWLVIKIGLADLPPFLSAGVRFAIAAVVLFCLSAIRRLPFPRSLRLHAGFVAIGMVAFTVSYGSVYWAEQYLPSGLTAVLFATNPFFTLVLAHFVVADERVTLRKAVGIAVGFAGVALIFRSDLAVEHPMAATAIAVLLLSPLAAASNSVAIKRWATHVHPITLTAFPMSYGALSLLAISLTTENIGAARWTPPAIASVLYLALFGSVIAFVIYYSLLREVPVTTLNLISYTFPIVALVLGFLVMNEVLEPLAIVGAAAILVGIAMTGYARAPSTGSPSQAATS